MYLVEFFKRPGRIGLAQIVDVSALTSVERLVDVSIDYRLTDAQNPVPDGCCASNNALEFGYDLYAVSNTSYTGTFRMESFGSGNFNKLHTQTTTDGVTRISTQFSTTVDQANFTTVGETDIVVPAGTDWLIFRAAHFGMDGNGQGDIMDADNAFLGLQALPTTAPEPTTLVLAALGVLGLGFGGPRRRRKRS